MSVTSTLKTVNQDTMNSLYAINPDPHSEKAWIVPPESPTSPPMGAKRTIADAQGHLTVLVTCLYNRDGTGGVHYGSIAAYKILGAEAAPGGGLTYFEVCEHSGAIPFRDDVRGLVPGGYYYIQPLTVNTEAKLLPSNVVPAP